MRSQLLSLVLFSLVLMPSAWADTGESTTTLTIAPSATAGTTITASDENSRNSDVTTFSDAHIHDLDNTTNFGDGAAGNKQLCADAADTTDACIRWDDTANLWLIDNPTAGTFNQVATMSGTSGLTSGRAVFGDGTGSIRGVASTDLIDLSGIDASTTTEGLILPQNTSCSSATTEGQICWDTNSDTLHVGDSSASIQVGGNFAVGNFTRDTTTASGTQEITGVGFQPITIIFFVAEHSAVGEMSIGFDDGTSALVISDSYNVTANEWSREVGGGSSIQIFESVTLFYQGSVTTLGSDGFTITWVRTSTPSGTIDIIWMAFG